MKKTMYRPFKLVYNGSLDSYELESMPNSASKDNVACFNTPQEAEEFVQGSVYRYPNHPITILKLYV